METGFVEFVGNGRSIIHGISNGARVIQRGIVPWKPVKNWPKWIYLVQVEGVEARPQITYISFSRWWDGRTRHGVPWNAATASYSEILNASKVTARPSNFLDPSFREIVLRAILPSPPLSPAHPTARPCRRESKEYKRTGWKMHKIEREFSGGSFGVRASALRPWLETGYDGTAEG